MCYLMILYAFPKILSFILNTKVDDLRYIDIDAIQLLPLFIYSSLDPWSLWNLFTTKFIKKFTIVSIYREIIIENYLYSK